MRSRLLHVVVGAGLPIYFANSVESVLEKSGEDVMAIYNAIEARDRPDLSALVENFPGRIVKIVVGDNRGGDPKVGALYSAYNSALDYAQDKYSWVSFIQGDQQMMRWPTDMPSQLDALFSEAHEDKKRVFCVDYSMGCFGFLGFPQHQAVANERGKVPGRSVFFNPSRGLADVGIFSISQVNDLDFRFFGGERLLSNYMVGRGFKMASLDTPILAFVPWPATIRNGRRRGRERIPEGRDPILKLTNERILNFAGVELPSNNTWQENLVLPNKFRTPWPYWASDVVNPKWIWRRRKLNRALGVSFFASIDPDGLISNYFSFSRFPRSPGLFRFVMSVIAGLLFEVGDTFRRYWRDAGKKIRNRRIVL